MTNYSLDRTETSIVIIIVIIGGRVGEFLEQSKFRVRVFSERDESGVYHRGDQPFINWQGFIRGFAVGLIIFEFYGDALFFYGYPMPYIDSIPAFVLSILNGFSSQLTGGILLGFTFGSIYGLGLVIIYVIENLSDKALGYIGLFLGFLGTLVLVLQASIS